jgi:rubrerythrin
MNDLFLHAGEILDLAIQMEHRGVTFHEACTKASLGPPIVLVFEHLIAAEQNHARIFAEMKARPPQVRVSEKHSRGVQDYMEKLISDRMSPETKRALRIVPEIADPVEAVEIAMEFEKKSVLLYSALNRLMGPADKEIIEKIIAEEHTHIHRLVDLLHELEN